MHGTVIRNTGSWYVVRTDDGRHVRCKVKGNFRLRGIRSTSPVAVGDGVTLGEETDGTAYITELDERRNYIVRKASNLSKQSHILAANVDATLLVVTVARPVTTTTFIDRFLASAEAYRVPALLAFNKTDEMDDAARDEAEALMLVYRHIGYDCFPLSALTGDGLDALCRAIAGKTVLLAGHSGVGKSTLLNRLVPGADARTASISETHQTGQHTTTSASSTTCPAAARSSISRASKASARSTWTPPRWATTSATSSPCQPVAASTTAPTRTNRDAPCSAPSTNIGWLPHAMSPT